MDSFIHSFIHSKTRKSDRWMPQSCRTEEDRFQGRCFQLRVSGISDILMGFLSSNSVSNPFLRSSPRAPVKAQSSEGFGEDL